jgi:hypothetical protein
VCVVLDAAQLVDGGVVIDAGHRDARVAGWYDAGGQYDVGTVYLRPGLPGVDEAQQVRLL